MKPQSAVVFSVLFCVVAFESYVNGAQCLTTADCTDTTYTSTICTSDKVCACKSNAVPIRTGCGIKLATPVVTQETGRTTEFIEGSTGVLTCLAGAGVASYAWYLDNVLLNANSQSINITKAGAYKCQALSSTTSLNSDQSAALTITAIEANSQSTNVPTVKVSPEGRTVTLTCSGAPLGYAGTTSFLVETITDPVAETTTSMSAQLNMNSSYYTKKVSCKLATFMTVTFAESAKVDLPSEDTGITVSSVSATVTDAGGNVINLDTDYQIGAAEPTVTCQSSPAPESLDPSKNLIYQFFNPYSATSVQTGNSKTYKVPTSEPGELTYTCSATYGTNAAVTSSATIRIKVKSDSFVTAHDLTKVSPDVLNIGSTLILSCGTTLDASRTYTWSFNNQLIDGQADWKIQLYNFMEIDIGWYTCRATKVGFKAEESFIVAIMKPYIARVPAGDFFGQYGVYDLKCITGSSENTGWTFSWKKDKDVTLIATDTYPIINATSATHDGTYTCTAIYNGVSSYTEEFAVAIVAPGKRCATSSECVGRAFSGKCTTIDPKVCECSANYFLKGETCASSGATALISCVLMVIIASLGSVFF